MQSRINVECTIITYLFIKTLPPNVPLSIPSVSSVTILLVNIENAKLTGVFPIKLKMLVLV